MLGLSLRVLVQAARAYCVVIAGSRFRRINVARPLSARAKDFG